MIKIIFIGLSNKVNKTPLSSGTISGDLIDKIINNLKFQCIKTNLVNFAPIDKNGKLRYPNIEEKNKGFETLEITLENNSPYIAVCLGRGVSDYLNNKVDNILSIKHPAYIAVYNRKDISIYINDVVDRINSIIPNIKLQEPLQK